MAQAKRKPSSRGKKKGRGLLLLVLGLGIGIAGVFLAQLVIERQMHRTVAGWFKRDKTPDADKTTRKENERPKSKFDFYTILPETETVLPDRTKKEQTKSTKTEKSEKTVEEGVTYVLQAASFNNYNDADQLKAKLALQGLPATIQKVAIDGKGEYHRVRLGPYEKVDDLDAASQQLSRLGIKAIRLKVKKGAG
jgi:cell division protein FtsN